MEDAHRARLLHDVEHTGLGAGDDLHRGREARGDLDER